MIKSTIKPALKLRNCMEDIVEKHLDEILQQHKDMCLCEDCRLDILALTLNSLPPRYIITDLGAIYSKIEVLDVQSKVKVITAISRAALKVAENPRHPKKRNSCKPPVQGWGCPMAKKSSRH